MDCVQSSNSEEAKADADWYLVIWFSVSDLSCVALGPHISLKYGVKVPSPLRTFTPHSINLSARIAISNANNHETYSTVVTGIVRVVLLDGYDRHTPKDYNYSLLFCLSTIEVGLSFIAACAPAMKPIIAKVIPKVLGTSSRSGMNKYSRGGTARMGYQLDHMSRQTQHGPNRTHVDAGGNDDDSTHSSDLPVQGIKKGIAVTTETEVKWHDSTKRSKNGSSTESLV